MHSQPHQPDNSYRTSLYYSPEKHGNRRTMFMVAMKCYRVAVALACTMLFSASVGAFPIPEQRLLKMLGESDVVAVVLVQQVTTLGFGSVEVHGDPIRAEFRVAQLRFTQVLKGSAPPDGTVSVRYTLLRPAAGWAGGIPEHYALSDSLPPNAFRIVFLKHSADAYSLTDGAYLSISAPAKYCSIATDGLASQLVSCLRDTLMSRNASFDDRRSTLYQLDEMTNAHVVPSLRDFLNSEAAQRSSELRGETLRILILRHDESMVDAATTLLLQPLMSSESKNYCAWKGNIMSAFTRTLPPSRSVPVLSQALHLAEPTTRRHAAESLGDTNSPLAISPLLSAITDADPQVAFNAMQGLGNLTKQYDWRPHSSSKDEDWFRCLRHWQEYRDSPSHPQ